MTGQEMLNLMSANTDISNGLFPPNLKLTALNNASLAVMRKLPAQWKKAFEVEKTTVASGDTANAFGTTQRGGVNGIIYVYFTELEKFGTKISLDQFLKYQQGGLADYYTYPRYYFKGDKIYFVPDDKTATITYYVNPTTITDGDSAIASPFYDELFHKTIVDLAIAMLINNKQNELFAYEELKKVAEEFAGTDTNKFGVKERYLDTPQTDPQWSGF